MYWRMRACIALKAALAWRISSAVVDVIAEVFRGLRQLLERTRGHARHQVGQEADAGQEQHDGPGVVGAFRRGGRARRQHRQNQFGAVAQAHVDAFAGAAPLHAHQAEHHRLLERGVAGARARGDGAQLVGRPHARCQRAREFALVRRQRRRRCAAQDFGERHAGTVGDFQVGAARRRRHDLGGHDQLFAAVEPVQFAELVDHALALGVRQQLGQRGGDQDPQQQGAEHAARHRAEESSHAAGSTLTWPAST
jgi:hypothetical protein